MPAFPVFDRRDERAVKSMTGCAGGNGADFVQSHAGPALVGRPRHGSDARYAVTTEAAFWSPSFSMASSRILYF